MCIGEDADGLVVLPDDHHDRDAVEERPKHVEGEDDRDGKQPRSVCVDAAEGYGSDCHEHVDKVDSCTGTRRCCLLMMCRHWIDQSKSGCRITEQRCAPRMIDVARLRVSTMASRPVAYSRRRRSSHCSEPGCAPVRATCGWEAVSGCSCASRPVSSPSRMSPSGSSTTTLAGSACSASPALEAWPGALSVVPVRLAASCRTLGIGVGILVSLERMSRPVGEAVFTGVLDFFTKLHASFPYSRMQAHQRKLQNM